MNQHLPSLLLVLVLVMMVFAVALLHEDLTRLRREISQLNARAVVTGEPAGEPPPNDPAPPPPSPAPQPPGDLALGAVDVSIDRLDIDDAAVEPDAADAEPNAPAPAPPGAGPTADDAIEVEAEVDADAAADSAAAGTTVADAEVPSPSPRDPAGPIDPPGWERYGPTVEQIIREAFAGEFGAIVERFDEDMAAALPRDRLAAALGPILRDAGPFQRVVARRTHPARLPEYLHAYNVIVQTADNPALTFTITLNTNKQIAGFYIN